jgi:hypothetical protein
MSKIDDVASYLGSLRVLELALDSVVYEADAGSRMRRDLREIHSSLWALRTVLEKTLDGDEDEDDPAPAPEQIH